jgi:tetratricopeptide (TPR) repeat protein/tRNA A-37 threonylcarbamoyl transferase component Bud32
MKAVPTFDAEGDSRLDEVLGSYLAAIDTGNAPEPTHLLANHPDLSNRLARFFANSESVTRWTAPLRTIAEAARAQAAEPAPAGTRFGDYEVLEEIGSGGMGIVYKARQRRLNRIVALKMIRTGRLCTAAERQRFRHEAETVALLDHARIVPVYEVGEWAGEGTGQAVPYFSMKWFEGGSLADRPDRCLGDPHAAVQAVVEIARAVHHAHQRGVLHRDLKPSNIVLDAEGRPHVADFGLAKLTASQREQGEVSLTATGAPVGTPAYMAPEQALGLPLTTAADVYGLGAILYVLLTGRPPFRATSVLETLECVRDREPDPPSGINSQVDRDLQAICLKCLSKQPDQRYASAEALAEDLQRWLDGQPILARPVSAMTRLWRWCRRNPVLAGLSTIAALAVMAAFTSLIVGAALVWKEKNQKEAALEAEQTQRVRAEEKERMARRAVADYMRVADEWLASEPGMTEVVREFLEKALVFYEGLSREQGADAEARYRAAQAYHFVARIHMRLGNREKANEKYWNQVELLNDLIAEFPKEGKYRFDLFHCYLGLAGVPVHGDEGTETVRTALNIIKGLLRDYPEEPNYRDALASATIHYAALVYNQGNLKESEQLAGECLRIALELDREYPNKMTPPYFLANAARSWEWLANIQRETGRPTEAEASSWKAIKVWDKLAAAHPKDPDEPGLRQAAVSGRVRLADFYLNSNKADKALECLDQCLPAAERLAREFAHGYTKRTGVARVLLQRSHCLLNLGRQNEARNTFEQYVRLMEELIREFTDAPELKLLLVDQFCTFPLAHPEERRWALQLTEEATANAPDSQRLGLASYRAGRWTDCIRELEKTTRDMRQTNVTSLLFLAMAHWQNGEKEQAKKYYGETITRLEKSPDYAVRPVQTEAAELMGLK